nr:MAG TPA: hypothetical protein [Siphoviridae sp. ctngg6]
MLSFSIKLKRKMTSSFASRSSLSSHSVLNSQLNPN